MNIKPTIAHYYINYWTKWMQYAAWGKNEIYKPFAFFQDYALFILLLSNKGIDPSVRWQILVYFLIMGFFMITGLIYYKSGAQKVTTTMNNTQNLELIAIHNDIKLIKEKLRI